MTLEHQGFLFLRRDKDCQVALYERTPRPVAGQPDILGVTKSRYLLEIEIKRSLSDFRANASKFHIRARHLRELAPGEPESTRILKSFPRFYWFLVPTCIHERVLQELPQWAGLLTPRRGQPWILDEVKKPPVNPSASRLTAKEAISLGRLMSNQIWSLSEAKSLFVTKEDEYVSDPAVWI